MFDNDNKKDEETSFSEAYKSQILGNDEEEEEEETSSKLLIIIGLVVVISGLSVFGYIQLSENNQAPAIETPTSQTVEEEPTKVEETEAPPQSMMINNMDELLVDDDENESEVELEDSTDGIKLEMDKELESKKTTKQKGEDTYLEQLAELSKEIDGEEK